MPGTVRPIVDERDGLLAFLEQQRDALRITAFGLTEEQARATPSVSALSIGGLIKHVARVERHWIVETTMQQRLPDEWQVTDWAAEHRLLEHETLAGALEIYAEVAKETEAIVRSIPDLGRPVPVPRDAPWFPKDVENWSVRWVLFHLIQETARHAGHADIVRESLDGSSFYPLMAAAEGRPGQAW
jgi:uncharacterized damage-inducible protein DinB